MPRKKHPRDKFLPLIDLPVNVPLSAREELAWFTAARPQEPLGEQLIRLDRILVLSEMIRDRWDSQFRHSDRPKASEDAKGYKLKSQLLSKTLDLIQEVNLTEESLSSIKWFLLVVWELQIDGLYLGPSKAETKNQARQILQFQNSQIKAHENPFSPSEAPHTFELLERARILAQSLDKFRENRYTPFRQAREAVTTHLIGEALLYKEHGRGFKPSRQGRTSTKLPQKKSNPLPERDSSEKI